MIGEGRRSELLKERPIHKGDFFQIEPGTVHAIKGGTLILEIQQSSDVTYRLYDYDRLQNGKLRELHLQQSMDVIGCPHRDAASGRETEESDGCRLERLVSCPFYTVEHMMLHGETERKAQPLYEIVDVVDGVGRINDIEVRKGDHFLIPAGFGDYKAEGEMELMFSRP